MKKKETFSCGYFHVTNARVQFKNIIGNQKNVAKRDKEKSTVVKLPVMLGTVCFTT